MLPTFIAILATAALIVLWIIFEKHKLAVLDENSRNAMGQIGMQLSSRFDAVTALLDSARGHVGHEYKTLTEAVQSGRAVITANSLPEEVQQQEDILSNTLKGIHMITEKFPDLKTNQNYIKAIGAAEIFENMVRTSRLIYNDSVTKLNRAIRLFPVSMIAGMLGFRQRAYLVEHSGEE